MNKSSLFFAIVMSLIFNCYFIQSMEIKDYKDSFEIADQVLKKHAGSIYRLQCLIKNTDDSKDVTVDLDSRLKEHSDKVIDQLIIPSRVPGVSLLITSLLIGTYLSFQGNNYFLDGTGLYCAVSGVKKLIDYGQTYQDKEGYKFRNLINQSFTINPRQGKLVEVFFDADDVSVIKLLINNKAIYIDPAQLFSSITQ